MLFIQSVGSVRNVVVNRFELVRVQRVSAQYRFD